MQVFQNLLNNAFSFTPKNGLIEIYVELDTDWVTVCVQDNGRGIPSSSLSRIFDRFYSERPESERFGAHSGLGLSISRQIVEAHGGIIKAENSLSASREIIGARFIVCLPRA